MNRRLFFRALAGAPVAAASAATTPARASGVSLAPFPHPWRVDQPNDMTVGAEAILLMGSRVAPSEFDDLLDFYHGNQWDAKIRRLREAEGRPCLVVNRLPALAAVAIAYARHTLSENERMALAVTIAHRNQDAQRLHNYIASADAEVRASRPKSAAHRVHVAADRCSACGSYVIYRRDPETWHEFFTCSNPACEQYKIGYERPEVPVRRTDPRIAQRTFAREQRGWEADLKRRGEPIP